MDSRLQDLYRLYELYEQRALGQVYIQKPQAQESKITQNTLKDSIEHCRLCQRSKLASPSFGLLQESSRVAFITQVSLLNAKNHFLENKSAKMLQDIISKVFRFSSREYSLLSLLKCGDMFGSAQEVEICKQYLVQQLGNIPQALVFCFLDEVGLEVFDFLDRSLFGRVVEWQGRHIIFTHSLTTLARNPSLKQESLHHMRLAQEILAGGIA